MHPIRQPRQALGLRFFSSSPDTGLSMLAVATFLACVPAAAQDIARGEQAFVPGRILVMPRAGMPEGAMAATLKENGGGKARRVGKSELRIVDLPPGLEKQAVEKLSRHPHFKFAELDRLVPPDLATNDPYLGSEWHLAKIEAPAAWDSAQGAGVTIAILDTGVDGSHPDLAPRMVAGWNFYDNNSNTADVYGHGTKVAGSAAAAANNATGVAGVAGQARIMPIRVADVNGYASWSALTQGLTWAADNGARVANISYVVANSAAVISAAQYMKNKGGLVFTSAGNYGTDAAIAPTTAMIPVSATNSTDAMTSWSSYGSFVALAAPGEGIYTTTAGGGYGAVSGTSFSSPISAGAAALVMSANPKLAASEVEQLLYSTALDLGSAGRDVYYGYGRVNAAAAVQSAKAAVSTADTTAPAVMIVSPSASGTVSGLVPVDVSAQDNVGVARVELRVNGGLVASDTAAPFALTWDSTKAPNGMASLVATAVDAAGNAGSSASVAVNVANTVAADTTPPVVTIMNPVDGAKVSGSVSIKVSAGDNNGAASLRQVLYINGATVASATGGSLSYSWNTRKVANGTYTIQAVATDLAGNSSSKTVRVTR